MSNNTAPVKTAMVIANCTAVDGVSAVSVCCGLVIISIDVVIVAFGGILAAAICGCMHSAVMHCDNASDFHMDMSYIHSDSMYAGGILVSTRIRCQKMVEFDEVSVEMVVHGVCDLSDIH